MIHRMFNLTCEKGHKWFAPDPDYWVGRDCSAATGKAKVCGAKLKKLK